MNVARKLGSYRVGEWEFSEASGELRRRTEVRRLEPRAAKALRILCDANGDVVSQERLIADVWGGRALSDNSVAVVVGQLRKALDDDAREPRLIETIPKRGYRLRIERPVENVSVGRKYTPMVIGALFLLLLGAWVARSWLAQPTILTVTAADVSNDTGNPQYGPLARATSELIVTELGARGYSVRRTGDADLTLRSKLVMWDNMPFLGINATDRTGEVRYSLMANAGPGRVPPAIERAFDELAARYPPKGGRERLAERSTDR